MKTFVQAADNGSPLLSNLDGTRIFRLELITVESRLFEPVARVHAIQSFFYYYYYYYYFLLPRFANVKHARFFRVFIPDRAVKIAVKEIALITRTGRRDRFFSFFFFFE